MLASMCVESHLREFLELGFEVAVVRDAVAAPKIPEGDGYLSALINFRYMANGLWTTDESSTGCGRSHDFLLVVLFIHRRDLSWLVWNGHFQV
jgi:hypothetical protein